MPNKKTKPPSKNGKPKTKSLTPAKLEQMPDGTVRAWYKISQLTLDPHNAREHGDEDLEEIWRSIEDHGQQKPVVVDADGIVRAGNGTCRALKLHQQETVWGFVSQLRGPEAVQFALRDNRTAELSQWDYRQAAANVLAVQKAGGDITRLGWNESDLQSLLAMGASAKVDLSPLFEVTEEAMEAAAAGAHDVFDRLILSFPEGKGEVVRAELLKHGATCEEGLCAVLGL